VSNRPYRPFDAYDLDAIVGYFVDDAVFDAPGLTSDCVLAIGSRAHVLERRRCTSTRSRNPSTMDPTRVLARDAIKMAPWTG